jgi:leucyl/phenylalanyl-tRNA--protein transferase
MHIEPPKQWWDSNVTELQLELKAPLLMSKTVDESHPPPGSDPQRPTPELLLWAYRHGVFPMANPDTHRIDWYSPDPRGVIPLTVGEGFHVPRNVAREIRRRQFVIRSDTAFEHVMRSCATDRNEVNRTWIDERIIAAYAALHRKGHAHCVEAWRNDQLVGGLYGVHIGGAFFGESMFIRPDLGGTDSSKVCLVHLVNHMSERGFSLLDAQFRNPHLDQFGCVEIPADEYLQRLANAVDQTVTWGAFRAC